jgi:hypothetical protein
MIGNADDILGPAVLVWRNDPLFNQGHICGSRRRRPNSVALVRHREGYCAFN